MVGKNIKKLRSTNGLTQEELAAKLNVTRQALSSWETGRTEPDIDTLERISQVLEVSIEDVIYGEQGTKAASDIAVTKESAKTAAKNGVSLGCVIAVVISYIKWHSIGWAVLHGVLGWAYVIYFGIKYGWN